MPNRLKEIVSELVTRPGHEKVRVLVHELLVSEIGVQSTEIEFERPLPEVRGRLDALLGCTVFEFKRDLRAEKRDAEEKLSRYMRQRERETGERFLGVATDGASFLAYELRTGRLVPLKTFQPSKDEPRYLVVWLDTATSTRQDLTPDPDTIEKQLGRESLAYQRAKSRLETLWEEVRDSPGVQVKRQLWEDLIHKVYGTRIGADTLFIQHTYLTIVAKTMAARVLDIPTDDPMDLLSGRPFHEAGISGAIESDFFDWVLSATDGDELIIRIARQVTRFRLRDIEQDVLKSLYESLIDPEQRHDLGEYYTPDWLAARICEHVIDNPLEERVLDPACGSGAFLLHAVRLFLKAADEAGLSNRDALAQCTGRIIGVDVHPIAVLFARVTYLLALGEERLQDRPETLSIPVYLGDSLQWNTRQFYADREVLIDVPDGPILAFPPAVTKEPSSLDAVIGMILDLSERKAKASDFTAWLSREGIASGPDKEVLKETYREIRKLQAAGRDHIWGYVARNLVRPIWLSSREQQADVIVGNPPWLSYRFMSGDMQKRFREECKERSLWAGGQVATHQDLSGYFFARTAELYLKDEGVIAFVMPYAAMTRAQFKGFRRGDFAFLRVRFTGAWAFTEEVQPLFNVPSCVLFARRMEWGAVEAGALPSRIVSCRGQLPRHNATPIEADKALSWRKEPWPAEAALVGGSPYREIFRNGATIYPRRLCVVERIQAGRLGASSAAPIVESRISNLDKAPWRDLPPLRGPVEKQFLRPLYLGESVAPYHLLQPALCVMPWGQKSGSERLLDASGARAAGYPHLARWMGQAEEHWETHKRSDMTFVEQLDYYGKLSVQLPPAPVRVVYIKSGTLPAAAVLRDQAAIVEQKLYWAPVKEEEAYYLLAILNSDTLRKRVSHLQSRGQWGARDFAKVVFAEPYPLFNPEEPLHRELAKKAREAEKLAAAVDLREGLHFVSARRLIRDALREQGIAQEIDDLVEELLESS
ncbi:N-6 DNA methylase [Nitrospinae bacterium AH_259_B05_G02_I21]|nr:N-6 DNA methylase [Nitrospinae bacterium AH_259_B05_G02_I21]MDA2932199.1 N-6 DNA methylase [Nitrospinae bacterium AH-259-F20]